MFLAYKPMILDHHYSVFIDPTVGNPAAHVAKNKDKYMFPNDASAFVYPPENIVAATCDLKHGVPALDCTCGIHLTVNLNDAIQQTIDINTTLNLMGLPHELSAHALVFQVLGTAILNDDLSLRAHSVFTYALLHDLGESFNSAANYYIHSKGPANNPSWALEVAARNYRLVTFDLGTQIGPLKDAVQQSWMHSDQQTYQQLMSLLNQPKQTATT